MVVKYADCENPNSSFALEVDWDAVEHNPECEVILYDTKGAEADRLMVKTGGSGIKYFILGAYVYGIYNFEAILFTEIGKQKKHIFGGDLTLSIMKYGVDRCGIYFDLTRKGGFTGVHNDRVLCKITEKQHKVSDNNTIELEPAFESDRKRFENAVVNVHDLASIIDNSIEPVAVDLEYEMSKRKDCK